ncbi:hypothetical protein CSAL01_12499 [Colletotrichum salicis]|uniref:Uncharacterized protein n=1 Tax=Colletotrichum salicis TaxID=1209931 RepID=A0A135SK85_9PEZI|nr:hypothetical protein CSAL01_12499 [Colletotrichum salicis]
MAKLLAARIGMQTRYAYHHPGDRMREQRNRFGGADIDAEAYADADAERACRKEPQERTTQRQEETPLIVDPLTFSPFVVRNGDILWRRRGSVCDRPLTWGLSSEDSGLRAACCVLTSPHLTVLRLVSTNDARKRVLRPLPLVTL